MEEIVLLQLAHSLNFNILEATQQKIEVVLASGGFTYYQKITSVWLLATIQLLNYKILEGILRPDAQRLVGQILRSTAASYKLYYRVRISPRGALITQEDHEYSLDHFWRFTYNRVKDQFMLYANSGPNFIVNTFLESLAAIDQDHYPLHMN
jgi:hypothetical protein